MKAFTALLLSAWAIAPGVNWAKDGPSDSPQAGGRTYAQNYKDMVLADCIATAYKGEPDAAQDAGSSASALMDWTYFDLEQAPQVGKPLIDQFLARDYRNPVVESERPGSASSCSNASIFITAKNSTIRSSNWLSILITLTAKTIRHGRKATDAI